MWYFTTRAIACFGDLVCALVIEKSVDKEDGRGSLLVLFALIGLSETRDFLGIMFHFSTVFWGEQKEGFLRVLGDLSEIL